MSLIWGGGGPEARAEDEARALGHTMGEYTADAGVWARSTASCLDCGLPVIVSCSGAISGQAVTRACKGVASGTVDQG